ncbi:MAG: methyltransferase domain-containing protein [Epsilonproteobacteria bacterium]|nr:methyltransferase domain-containing protein [Campylobacterota bacterium]
MRIIVALFSMVLLWGNAFAAEHQREMYRQVTAQKKLVASKQFLDALHSLGHDKFENLMEVGCDSGDLAVYAMQKFGASSIRALDKSKENIEEARKKCGNLEGYTFLSNSTEHDVSAATVDLVYSFGAWHWFADHRQALEVVAKALKPGGVFYMNASCYLGDDHPLVQSFNEVMQMECWQHLFSGKKARDLYNPVRQDEFVNLLDELGFKVESTQESVMSVPFPSVDAFKSFLSVILEKIELLTLIPLSDKISLLDDICNRLATKIKSDANGQILYEIPSLIVLAVKK